MTVEPGASGLPALWTEALARRAVDRRDGGQWLSPLKTRFREFVTWRLISRRAFAGSPATMASNTDPCSLISVLRRLSRGVAVNCREMSMAMWTRLLIDWKALTKKRLCVASAIVR